MKDDHYSALLAERDALAKKVKRLEEAARAVLPRLTSTCGDDWCNFDDVACASVKVCRSRKALADKLEAALQSKPKPE